MIERAVGVLMERHRLDQLTAFERLRSSAAIRAGARPTSRPRSWPAPALDASAARGGRPVRYGHPYRAAPQGARRLSRLMRRFLPVLAALALLTVAAPAAEAKTPQLRPPATCATRSRPGGKKTFGVFKLQRPTGATCLAAHHAAHAWMDGVRGLAARRRAAWSCRQHEPAGSSEKELQPNAAQTYRLRGTKRPPSAVTLRLRRAQRLGLSAATDRARASRSHRAATRHGRAPTGRGAP